MNELTTRRKFLRVAAVTGVGLAAAWSPRLPQPDGESEGEVGELISSEKWLRPVENASLQVLGEAQRVEINRRDWSPDTQTSFVYREENNDYEVYFSAGRDGYRAVWAYDAQRKTFEEREKAQQIFAPSNKRTELGFLAYQAEGSVIAVDKDWRVAALHREYHPSADKTFPFHAEVALALSRDQGKTWESMTTILRSPKLQDEVSGVGQPWLSYSKGELTCYYTDWSQGTHSIHMARASLENILEPDGWRKWHKGAFDSPGMEGPSSLVVSGDVYAALPSVYGGVLVCETNTGFAYSQSTDGVRWTEPQLFVETPSPLTQRQDGNLWASYPSLFLPRDVDNEGLLIFSGGKWNQDNHRMYSQSFSWRG